MAITHSYCENGVTAKWWRQKASYRDSINPAGLERMQSAWVTRAALGLARDHAARLTQMLAGALLMQFCSDQVSLGNEYNSACRGRASVTPAGEGPQENRTWPLSSKLVGPCFVHSPKGGQQLPPAGLQPSPHLLADSATSSSTLFLCSIEMLRILIAWKYYCLYSYMILYLYLTL